MFVFLLALYQPLRAKWRNEGIKVRSPTRTAPEHKIMGICLKRVEGGKKRKGRHQRVKGEEKMAEIGLKVNLIYESHKYSY